MGDSDFAIQVWGEIYSDYEVNRIEAEIVKLNGQSSYEGMYNKYGELVSLRTEGTANSQGFVFSLIGVDPRTLPTDFVKEMEHTSGPDGGLDFNYGSPGWYDNSHSTHPDVEIVYEEDDQNCHALQSYIKEVNSATQWGTMAALAAVSYFG